MKIRVVLKHFGKGILASLKWILKTIRQIPGLLGEKPILTALIFLIIIGYIVLRITISTKQEGVEFIGNIIAEGYGVIFDIFVFGILIAFFNWLGEKRRDIKRWKEEIDDFRHWESEEAKFRIVGNIRRLNKAGVSNINLSSCYLNMAILSEANLKRANLWGAQLEGASLRNANLEKANLLSANLKGAFLTEANLKGAGLSDADLEGTHLQFANLERANLFRANLKGANLKGANLDGSKLWQATLEGANLAEANLGWADLFRTNLKGAILFDTNLKEAINISLNHLSNVKTLFRAKLDLWLEGQVKAKYPHLLEDPKMGSK